LEEARGLATQVLQQDPDNVSAKATVAFLDSAEETQLENKLRKTIQVDPSSAASYDRLAEFLWSQGKDLDEARRLALVATSLDAGNTGYRINLANILLSSGDVQAAIETLQAAATTAKSPEEKAAIDQRLKDAMSYASSLTAKNTKAGDEQTSPASETAQRSRSNHYVFVPNGPHHLLAGVLKAVRCEPPSLNLTLTSSEKTLTLRADNYYQIQFTALFTPVRDLQPCRDLENRPAKVEYVESADGQDTPRIIAIELRQ
jgi:tetratricopeptide (TPR) repeat protein